MNIFVLDEHPRLAAEYHCDKHIVKQVTESAQLLCNAHHYYKTLNIPFGVTHQNHPCSIWARANHFNYYWLWCLFYWQAIEYQNRYHRVHASARKCLKFTMAAPSKIPVADTMTPFVQAMPDQYKHKDPVIAYRQYYSGDKRRFARWAHGPTPFWWETI